MYRFKCSRKMDNKIALSSTVLIKYTRTSKVVPIIVNRLYSYPKSSTWNDVLNDLMGDNEHNIDKLSFLFVECALMPKRTYPKEIPQNNHDADKLLMLHLLLVFDSSHCLINGSRHCLINILFFLEVSML